MDIILYLLGALGVAVVAFWFILGGKKEEVAVQLPSSAELKKMKKAELVELAASKDIMVDIKSTKVVIIKEIESKR